MYKYEEKMVQKISENVLRLLNVNFLVCEDDFNSTDLMDAIYDEIDSMRVLGRSLSHLKITFIPNYHPYDLAFKIKFSDDNVHFFYSYSYGESEGNIIDSWE